MRLASQVADRHPSPHDLRFSDLTCHVRPGDRLGLLGRNSSGKTTLWRLLTGELAPTHAALLVVSHDRAFLEALVDHASELRGVVGGPPSGALEVAKMIIEKLISD